MVNKYYESINSFTYKGINSLDMGLFISEKSGIHGDAQPIIETINIPGRGTLIVDNKNDELDNEEFSDFEIMYKCYVAADEGIDIEHMSRNIYAWLFKEIEFDKLHDTYEQGYYRMAYISCNATISEVATKLLGEFEIRFMCKAYKRAIAGNKIMTITKGSTIYNTEGFTSYPYIKIYGNGSITLYINSRSHGFTDVTTYIEVDSELVNAYKGDTLQNSKMLTTVFPKLATGANTITWIGNVTKVEMAPRWCSL